ncbi:MAG: hypothetical protein JNJ54_20955 [Myxococcaceae bacterium]|nr:hypothetical protein [Myxococcaceae bacterium]
MTWRVTLALGTLTLLLGCADGANGDKGLVRFSQVVNFVETNDFTPPLVLGRTVLIKLEHAPLGEQSFPELSLEVTGGAAQVLPLGFAQYAVRLDEEKAYRFRAKEGTRELDAISVVAKKGARLRLHAKAQVVTSGESGGRRCVRAAAVNLADLTLAPNQEAAVTVVPVDDAGAPMLGMLQLTAKSSRPDLELDTPFFFEGGSPNTLTLRPTVVTGRLGDVSVDIVDPAFATLTQTVRVTAETAAITCN